VLCVRVNFVCMCARLSICQVAYGRLFCCGVLRDPSRVTHTRTHDTFLFARCRYLSIVRFSQIKGWVWGGHGVTVVAHGGQQRGQGPRPCTTKGATGGDRQTGRHTIAYIHYKMIIITLFP